MCIVGTRRCDGGHAQRGLMETRRRTHARKTKTREGNKDTNTQRKREGGGRECVCVSIRPAVCPFMSMCTHRLLELVDTVITAQHRVAEGRHLFRATKERGPWSHRYLTEETCVNLSRYTQKYTSTYAHTHAHAHALSLSLSCLLVTWVAACRSKPHNTTSPCSLIIFTVHHFSSSLFFLFVMVCFLMSNKGYKKKAARREKRRRWLR